MNPTPRARILAPQRRVGTLSKRSQVARLVLLTHQLGFELKVARGDILLTQVCKSGSGDRGSLRRLEDGVHREGLGGSRGRPRVTTQGPRRQAPSDAPADAIERVSPPLKLERGDIALIREPLPRVNPQPLSKEPQWRYRVCVEGEPRSSQFSTSFATAAARAEEIATEQSARLLFVEDGVVSLLTNYRPM